MTEDQFEKAARHFCFLRGHDPEELVWGSAEGMATRKAWWKWKVEELRKHHYLNESLAVAKEGVPTHD